MMTSTNPDSTHTHVDWWQDFRFWVPIVIGIMSGLISAMWAMHQDSVNLSKNAHVQETERFMELGLAFESRVYDFTNAVLANGSKADEARENVQKALLEQIGAARVFSDRLGRDDRHLLKNVELASLDLRRSIDDAETPDDLRIFFVHLHEYVLARDKLTKAMRNDSGATG